jgi:hydrophobic/amphiphilic exporter-1 (mainly G- bacteria), HAE1 family
MNISDIFIRRPVMTTLVMVAILIAGIMGYRLLPVNDLPAVDFPTLEVTATLPGASAETMASSVATPLEKVFSTISNLDSMSSVNTLGTTRITLQFNLNRNLDAAALDVQSSISTTLRNLPPEMPAPPTYRKVNPADQPIFYITMSSPTLRLSDVTEYAETYVAQQVSMISGVAQVQVFGSQKYAVRIQLDPEAMAAKGIGIDEAAAAIKRANVNLPTGVMTSAVREFTIESDSQLTQASLYQPVIITYRNGSPVRLQDIGIALDCVEANKRANWFDNERTVILAVQRQPGTNTVAVVDAIKALMPRFEKQIPASVNLGVMYDRSVSIRQSVDDVKFTLFLTVCLVVTVIFLFLRNFTATIIPSLALPMSIIGTFAGMYLLGYSLDNISLMALTLAVGFVVDDAIVMLENIVRHMEQGKKPFEAAIEGSKEISFTIVSMTLSLAAVFIPVLFMGGVVGRLFQEFAVTISISILVSGFVSLTLTPMLCAKMLRPGKSDDHHEHRRGILFKLYEISLRQILKHRFLTLVGSILLLAATVYLFQIVPKGFLPASDMGYIQATTESYQGISLEAMGEYQQIAAKIVANDPNVQSVMSAIGPGGSVLSLNAGRMFIRLKDSEQRKLSADEVINKLRPKLAHIPGMRVILQNPPSIPLGGRYTRALYQFTMQSTDAAALFEAAPEFESKMRELPMLQDVSSDLEIKNPQINLAIDRDRASALGLSPYQIEDALSTAYSSREISTIYAKNNTYKVLMELSPKFQTNPDSLSLLHVRSSNGGLVPLDTVTRYTTSAGPMSVNHSAQFPAVTISFNLKPGVALGEAVDAVESLARQTLPASFTTGFQGTAQAFQASFKGLWLLLALSIVVIYLVLGILYESFIHPLTILSGLPSAGAGALLTLMLFQKDLGLYGFVGIIMLIGIVKKNAIMMIDFALEAQRKENRSAAEAIYEGALTRFRPIMMTTMAALMGTLPIAVGYGAGGEARQPLGLAVVGGLVVSQLLTLYFTPVYYIYLDAFQKLFSRGKRSITP